MNNIKTQNKKRLNKVLSLLWEYTSDNFDEKTNWIAEGNPPKVRERLWFAISYLEYGTADSIDKANKIIHNTPFEMCHFSPMIAAQILDKYSDLTDSDSQMLLKKYLKDNLENFKPDVMGFVGINDNYPAMAMYACIVGGTLVDMPEMVELGKERLCYVYNMMRRRGVTTEYNSPTYTPIQARTFAELVEADCFSDEEAKEKALYVERCILTDILGHYVPYLYTNVGPFSRAYTVDSANLTHNLKFMLYAILGDEMKITPLTDVMAGKYCEHMPVIHGSGAYFMQLSCAVEMNACYHITNELMDLALNKKLPYLFKATTEYGPASDIEPVFEDIDPYVVDDVEEYGAGSTFITSYIDRNYGLGTAVSEFQHGWMNDSFNLTYRRNKEVKTHKDIGTLFCRYTMNNYKYDKSYALLSDQGRKICLQDKNAAMVLYRPKSFEAHGVNDMRLRLIIPDFYDSDIQIWVGNEKYDGTTLRAKMNNIFVIDGECGYILTPLCPVNYGREYDIEITKELGYIYISIINYKGEMRRFARKGFLKTGNGFAIEVFNRDEFENIDGLREIAKDIQTEDKYRATIFYRYVFMRITKYQRKDVCLECEYTPISGGIKHILSNGELITSDRLEIKNPIY